MAQNHRWVVRRPDGSPEHLTESQLAMGRGLADAVDERFPATRVVLTIAHLHAVLADGTVVSKHDKGHRHEQALACLCARCHLRHDREDHMRRAAETRRRKRIALGQMELLLQEVGY